MEIVKALVEAPGDGQKLQCAKRLRHQMPLHLGPAALVLGQGGAAGVVQFEHVDRRQVNLAVIDRPVNAVLAPALETLDPVDARVHPGPEQVAPEQLLVIEPLRQGELQPGRDRLFRDDLADHPVLQRRDPGHVFQMRLGLLRVIGHDQ